jgi:uncharacterized protein (DUF433 family)
MSEDTEGPVEIAPGITVDRRVLAGKPVIKGTRIPVALVIGQLAAGTTHEELSREYGLSAAAIKDALAYAYEVLTQETVWAS